MQINRWDNNPVDSVLVLLSEESCKNLPALPESIKDITASLIARKDFTGKKGSLLRVPMVEGTLYLAGLGKPAECKPSVIRDALASGLRRAGRSRAHTAFVPLKHLGTEGLGVLLGEAAGLCGYVFDKYKTKGEDYKPFALEEVFTDIDDAEGFRKGLVFAEAQTFSRDIVNEPGCAVWPQVMAEKAQALAEQYGFTCEVWDEERLRAERTGGLLAVGSGSKNPPRLIHLTYKPANPSKCIVFVGKGITFDSGGLNIKPDQFMLTMKGDKTGACNVLGVMKGAAELRFTVFCRVRRTCLQGALTGPTT